MESDLRIKEITNCLLCLTNKGFDYSLSPLSPHLLLLSLVASSPPPPAHSHYLSLCRSRQILEPRDLVNFFSI